MQRMRLSQPVTIPDQYRETVLVFLRDYWDNILWELRNQFGIELEIEEMPHDDDDYLSLLVAESISQIAKIAAGQTDGVDRADAYQGIQDLVEKLFSIPGESSYTIPQEFWDSSFGSIVLLALLWCQGDELITVSEAVLLSGKSMSYFSQLITKRKIRAYNDPSEPNPQRRRRLIKREIESLLKK